MEHQLLITEDNYEGYIELYNIEIRNLDKFKIVNGIFDFGMPVAIIMFFVITAILPNSIFPITFSMFIASEVGMASYYKVMSKKIKETCLNELKQKYPYVDENISFETLFSALDKEHILKKESSSRFSRYKADKKSYEKKLMQKKEQEKKNSEQVMDEFMKKLNNNYYDYSEPQIGEEFNPTPEFIEKTVSNYKKLLESGLISSFDEEFEYEEEMSLVKRKRDND